MISVRPAPEHEAQSRQSASLFGRPVTRGVLLGLGLVLVVATLAVYFPVNRYPFVSLNDGEYVTHNIHITQLNWEMLQWSFTSFYAANWHPLTWLSHALDRQLFSLDSGLHHDSNLLLHVLNTVLLFWILWRATASAGRSFMVAALFALHPMNVESVAWIAERKNLLSMFFLLLTLGAYRWYALKPRLGRYVMLAVLFALGLMSKPQVITLPFILLLWDYWPLGRAAFRPSLFAPRQNISGEVSVERRGPNNEEAPSSEKRIANSEWRWLILEKLPLLAVSAASAFLTVAAQRAGGAMGGVQRSYSITVRVQNAIVAYTQYLGKAVWPTRLAFFYPHASRFQHVWLESLLLLAITVLAVASRNHRYLAVGWLWFLGTLVPMIGLLQVGGQAMADRYAYLPFVGLFIAVCWGVSDWAEQWHVSEAWLAGASAATLLLLAFATHRQLSYWSDDVALWSHTVHITKNNSGAENVLGEALQREGRADDAMLHFRSAAAMDPLLPYPYYHIGVYEQQHGDPQGAIQQFNKVIALTQGDTGVMAGLRTDTLVRMYTAYNAIGDETNSAKCLNMALQERRKQQGFEVRGSP
jgi:protein O-mannosyl-transferase